MCVRISTYNVIKCLYATGILHALPEHDLNKTKHKAVIHKIIIISGILIT